MESQLQGWTLLYQSKQSRFRRQKKSSKSLEERSKRGEKGIGSYSVYVKVIGHLDAAAGPNVGDVC